MNTFNTLVTACYGTACPTRPVSLGGNRRGQSCYLIWKRSTILDKMKGRRTNVSAHLNFTKFKVDAWSILIPFLVYKL
jgi:hypothetical protein